MYNVSLVDLTDEGREFHFCMPKEMLQLKSQLGQFSTDLDVRGEVVQRDESFYIVHLEGQTEVEVSCRRCLKTCNSAIRFERELYIKKGTAEEEDSDADYLTIGPNAKEINLENPLRELVVLGFPAYPLCDESCKGLCPQCGRDLNEGTCDCRPESTDPRWDALRGLLDKNDDL